MLKSLKEPPSIVFGIVRFFKMNNFCLKIRFSQAQHVISDFVCFQRPAFFHATFFSNVFSSKPPPSIFTRDETFFEHEGLLKVFVHCATYRRPSSKNFVEKFRNKIFLNFLFFERFSVEKDGFSAVSS